MKRTIIIGGMALLILVALTGSLNAQRGMRGMHGMQIHRGIAVNDSLRMNMMRQHGDSLFRGGMQHRNGMRRGYLNGPGFGMRPCMMPGRPGMRQPHPGMRIIETIPNLTEKQKKDISDLRQKQMEEMKKFREDMSAKMNTMREANKAKIMNLLTDEQKKYLEGNKPAAPEKK